MNRFDYYLDIVTKAMIIIATAWLSYFAFKGYQTYNKLMDDYQYTEVIRMAHSEDKQLTDSIN